MNFFAHAAYMGTDPLGPFELRVGASHGGVVADAAGHAVTAVALDIEVLRAGSPPWRMTSFLDAASGRQVRADVPITGRDAWTSGNWLASGLPPPLAIAAPGFVQDGLLFFYGSNRTAATQIAGTVPRLTLVLDDPHAPLLSAIMTPARGTFVFDGSIFPATIEANLGWGEARLKRTMQGGTLEAFGMTSLQPRQGMELFQSRPASPASDMEPVLDGQVGPAQALAWLLDNAPEARSRAEGGCLANAEVWKASSTAPAGLAPLERKTQQFGFTYVAQGEARKWRLEWSEDAIDQRFRLASSADGEPDSAYSEMACRGFAPPAALPLGQLARSGQQFPAMQNASLVSLSADVFHGQFTPPGEQAGWIVTVAAPAEPCGLVCANIRLFLSPEDGLLRRFDGPRSALREFDVEAGARPG